MGSRCCSDDACGTAGAGCEAKRAVENRSLLERSSGVGSDPRGCGGDIAPTGARKLAGGVTDRGCTGAELKSFRREAGEPAVGVVLRGCAGRFTGLVGRDDDLAALEPCFTAPPDLGARGDFGGKTRARWRRQ